jgi:hypothetical protein
VKKAGSCSIVVSSLSIISEETATVLLWNIWMVGNFKFQSKMW